MKQIKWMLFDFGGCLDSDGVHSRTLFFNHFSNNGLITNESQSSYFQDAYTYSDRMVIDHSLILNSNLQEMNELMCQLIAEKLNIGDELLDKVSSVAKAITATQATYLKRNKYIIESLHRKYQLGIISNFSGNLTKILEEFSLLTYFNFVLDSYHVGCCKPNPEIFKLALLKCNHSPDEICFIGDNVLRDIIPAKSLGFKTILISTENLTSDADYTLTSLEELLLLAQRT